MNKLQRMMYEQNQPRLARQACNVALRAKSLSITPQAKAEVEALLMLSLLTAGAQNERFRAEYSVTCQWLAKPSSFAAESPPSISRDHRPQLAAVPEDPPERVKPTLDSGGQRCQRCHHDQLCYACSEVGRGQTPPTVRSDPTRAVAAAKACASSIVRGGVRVGMLSAACVQAGARAHS